MKRFQTIALIGLVAMQAAFAAQAGITREIPGPGSLNEFPQRWLPVLVNVDYKGKVTEVSPSTQLMPVFDRLLRKNLDELIVGPATDRKGKPVSSQFVMNVALKVSPREQGKYDASFAYLSTSPVPNGSWYWVHINGHRLALASRSNFSRAQHLYFEQSHPNGMNAPPGWRSNAPMPAFQNATRSPSAPAATPAGRGH